MSRFKPSNESKLVGMERFGIKEWKCKGCGKNIALLDNSQWRFKDTHKGKNRMYCSWSCFQKR